MTTSPAALALQNTFACLQQCPVLCLVNCVAGSRYPADDSICSDAPKGSSKSGALAGDLLHRPEYDLICRWFACS